MKINTGTSLRDYLTQLFEVSVKNALSQKALTEKEKQSQLSGGSDDSSSNDQDAENLFGDSGGDENDDEEQSTSSKTMDDETEKLKNGDVKTKDIVDKLNTIRAGKSFKDEVVGKSMDQWVESLSKAERVALLAFLKGISQIISGEVQGKEAEDPSENPSSIQMDKSNEPNVVHKKPNVIKKSSGSAPQGKQKNASDQEDTSAPVSAPITPKRR